MLVYGFLLITLFVFIFLLQKNWEIDKKNTQELEKMTCHKEVNLPQVSEKNILIVESIIEQYWKKRSMNKSNTSKIWGDVKMGVTRGILGGVLIGGTPASIGTSAFIFGTLSGVLRAYGLAYGRRVYLHGHKHT